MAAQRGLRKLAKLLERSEAEPEQAASAGPAEPEHEPGKKTSPQGVTPSNDSTLKDMR
jgi:hypothetical protein